MERPNRKVVWAQTECLDLEMSVGKLLNRLEELNAKYGPTARVESFKEEWGDSYWLMTERPETDKEYDRRIAQEQTDKVRKEEWDRREFERLKKKFGEENG